MAGELVSISNGGEPPPDRGDLCAAVCLGRQESSDCGRISGQGRDMLYFAPGPELRKI
jgi:hypothetical protein